MRRGWDLQSGHYRYLRHGVGTLFGALGLPTALRFAEWLADGVYDLNTPSRQLAEANLAIALGNRLDPKTRQRIVRQSFLHAARFWVEAIYLRRRLRPGNWHHAVQIADPAPWRRLRDGGRGSIILTTYFGNVAVLGYVLNQLLGGLHVLIHVAEQPVLRAWLEDLCRVPGLRLIYARQAVGVLPEILRRGGHVLMIGEHVRRKGRAMSVPMLGRVRAFYPTASLLSWGCQVPIAVAGCHRLAGDMRFVIEMVDWIDPPADSSRAALHAVTAHYAAALERSISAHPEQYTWARRWDPIEPARAKRPTS